MSYIPELEPGYRRFLRDLQSPAKRLEFGQFIRRAVRNGDIPIHHEGERVEPKDLDMSTFRIEWPEDVVESGGITLYVTDKNGKEIVGSMGTGLDIGFLWKTR